MSAAQSLQALTAMPWRSDEAACYGVACALHAECARYAAVEGNQNDNQVFISNCGPERLAFISNVPSRAHARIAGEAA